MKVVFLFIPSYVYCFDLLRTKYIEYLSQKYKVIVFLAGNEYFETYYKSKNVEYKVWELTENKFWGRMKLLRIGLIKEFDNLLSVKLHYENAFIDWRRKILRAVAQIWPFNIKASFFTKIEKLLLPNSTIFKEHIEKYKPSLVLTCTPGYSRMEAEIIALSGKNNLKTVAINFSWNNLTTHCKHTRKTDYLFTWNNIIKKEAVEIHKYNKDNVFVTGALRFDYYLDNEFSKIHKDDFIISKNLNPRLKTILLATASPGVYPYHKELIEILLKLRDDEKAIPFCNIFIRVHPKDSVDKYVTFKDIKNVHIEGAGKERMVYKGSRHNVEMELDDFANLKNTLRYCDISINYTSTITLEALVFDKPTINIGFPRESKRRHYEYVHYRKIIEKGAVRLAKDEEEFRDYINMYYKNPKIDQAQRKEIAKEFLGFMDGLSYERSVDFLEKIIN